jgi:hypothetical protein
MGALRRSRIEQTHKPDGTVPSKEYEDSILADILIAL